MKVMHLIDSLGYGGAEKLVVEMIPLLQTYGMEVLVVSMTDHIPLAEDLRKRGVRVLTLNFKGNIYSICQIKKCSAKLRKLIIDEKVDIINSHLYLSDILARISAPMKCKLVITLHNRDSWWYQNKIKSILKTKLDQFLYLLRKTYPVAVSQDVKIEAIKALKINDSSLTLIQNGINIQKFTPACHRKKLSNKYIVQVGRFYPQKGHVTALYALSILLQYFPDIKLYLVGDGPEADNLAKLAFSLGIQDSVEFMGIRNDVSDILKEAQLFWMPSKWEGMPIACLEAMASGLPVVATRVGGIPELIKDELNGLLVDVDSAVELANATKFLLLNEEIGYQFGMNGRALVENEFSLEATVNKYADLYNKIILHTSR